jgi:uncharacterized protein with HEPN domain
LGYVKALDFESFKSDHKTQDAVIRHFLIIGEASRHVPPEIMDKYSDIPWRLMGDFRNFLAHVYWGVEVRTIWDTIHNRLPPLIPQLKTILATLP